MLDLCIKLKDIYYFYLVRCLLKDVKDGELYNVFMNEFLKNISVICVFIEELMKKIYEELYVCFFLELKDEFRINWNKNDKYGVN